VAALAAAWVGRWAAQCASLGADTALATVDSKGSVAEGAAAAEEIMALHAAVMACPAQQAAQTAGACRA
jgi:hypothetical protein